MHASLPDILKPFATSRSITRRWHAARVRESGGVSAKTPDREAIAAYLDAIDIAGAIRGLKEASATRGEYIGNLALCFETMWDLAMEMIGKGEPVPYARCVAASTGRSPEPSNPTAKRKGVQALLEGGGYPSVEDWRRARLVSMDSVAGDAVIEMFDELAATRIVPYLPGAMREVPRANIQFLPIRDAWFSGSMNYLGRARKPDGSPEYGATYEINASLEISRSEFMQLVSHEVVPGHVTTFAYLQNLLCATWSDSKRRCSP